MYAFTTPSPVSSPISTRVFHAQKSPTPSPCPIPLTARRRSSIQCAAPLSRRHFINFAAAAAVAAAFSRPADLLAAAAPVVLGDRESDEQYGYSFATPPAGWTRSTATLSSFRTATLFVSDGDKDSNISMVVTPVPGDFQKLTSFGTIDNVLDIMIPTGRKDVEGKVISTRTDTAKNAYVVEYTITSGGIPRHLLTVFSLQPGRYLISLTGQSLEDNWRTLEPVIKAVADSYKLKVLD